MTDSCNEERQTNRKHLPARGVRDSIVTSLHENLSPTSTGEARLLKAVEVSGRRLFRNCRWPADETYWEAKLSEQMCRTVARIWT